MCKLEKKLFTRLFVTLTIVEITHTRKYSNLFGISLAYS